VKSGEALPVQTSEFGLGGSAIVPPLLVDEKQAAALLHRKSSQGQSQLFLVRLDQSGAQRKPLLECAPMEPRFAGNIYMANRSVYTFVVSATAGGCSLRSVRWSDASLVERGAWNIEFLAADMLLTRANQVRGVLLGRNGPRLAAVAWQFSEAGGFSADAPVTVDAAADRAIVGVNEDGTAFALLQTSGSWSCWSQRGGIAPLAADVSTPVRIVFAGGVDPVAVHTPQGRGFQFCSL
jgi:hypothetical protein